MSTKSFTAMLRFWAPKEEAVGYDHSTIVLSSEEVDPETVVIFSGAANRLWYEKQQRQEAMARAQQVQRENADAVAVRDFHLLGKKTIQVKRFLLKFLMGHLTNSQTAETILRAAKFVHEAAVLLKAVMGSAAD